MKILLIGEYSNVHWTLAEGLRMLGHEVTVLSDGDGWKNYQRDINLQSRSLGKLETLRYLADVELSISRLKDFDVVQIINPIFLDLKAERIMRYYRKLRRQNKKMFLGAFGIDRLWVSEGLKPGTFKYSDFYLNGQLRDYPFLQEMKRDWLGGAKGEVNLEIANDCDGIIAGLYEYWRCYRDAYAQKLTYIPYPINLGNTTHIKPHPEYSGIRFFIGIQKTKNAYKGTDIMLSALEELQKKYPEQMQIVKAESVPYPVYQNMMDTSDVLLDQLYSYTPAMNGLQALAKGLVLVGGGEEEYYKLQGEEELRPIINVQPTKEDVFHQIEEKLLLQPQNLKRLSEQSTAFIRRHHDCVKVARQYLDFWASR